jgi:hypothetical protein
LLAHVHFCMRHMQLGPRASRAPCQLHMLSGFGCLLQQLCFYLHLLLALTGVRAHCLQSHV